MRLSILYNNEYVDYECMSNFSRHLSLSTGNFSMHETVEFVTLTKKNDRAFFHALTEKEIEEVLKAADVGKEDD